MMRLDIEARPKIIAALAIVVAAGARVPAGQMRAQSQTIAITNATVIDVVSGDHQTGVTVLTKAGQIASIGPQI
jgi:hypothetical protein